MNESPREFRLQTICLLILSGIGIAVALYFLKPVLIPFVLAMFLAIGLAPVVDVQVRRLHMPHGIAVVSTLVLSAGILVLMAMLVSASFRELAANRDDYAEKANNLVRWAAEKLDPQETQPTTATTTPTTAPKLGDLELPTRHIRTALIATSKAMMGLVSNGLLVLICLCFLLFGTLTRSAPTTGAWGEIVRSIRHYILTKLLLSATTGVLVGLVLWLLGIKLAIVFGLLAFLLNFIPSIGSIIATLLPLPFVLLAPNVSSTTAAMAILIPGVIQFSLGSVIEPRIVGKSLNLHPIALILALIFWGMLWGIIGMFLATPLTVVLKILLEKHPLTAPLAGVLAGQVVNNNDAPKAD